MNTTLAKTLHWEKEPDYLDLDIGELVNSAAKVIAPLGPINTFAARHPWAGLEKQSFEQVARWLKDTGDVDLYPNDFIYQSAWKQGEINHYFLEMALHRWLDLQSLEMPRQDAEEYCRAALMLDKPSFHQLEGSDLKSIAKKLSRFKFKMLENHSVKTYSQRLEQRGGEKFAKELDRQMIKWCKLFLDESQAVWSMPNREAGFYQAWRRLVLHDPALKPAVRKQLHDWPKEADDALKQVLSLLEIPLAKIEDYLEAHLLALPGWAGMMLWRSQQSTREKSLVTDYLAVRISLEWAMMKPHLPLKDQGTDQVLLEPLIASCIHWGNVDINVLAQLPPAEIKARLLLAYRFDEITRNRLWLEAWEKTYENRLLEMITTQQRSSAEDVNSSLAQFAFCIDVRSEPFRRQLEKAGPFETFGTAGFFGLPIETSEFGSKHSHHSLPVMFKPQFKINEAASELESSRYQQRQHTASSLSGTFKTMKHNLVSSLLLPEISGPWLSVQTLARSFVPRSAGQAFRKILDTWLYKPSTELSIDHKHTSEAELPIGFTDEEKVHYVRQALKMMGLTDHFAPLVVICGHGSHSTNNPYASALDCGACGGASSGFNARVLAALCNLPKVRQVLRAEGISIPDDTVFAAAEHITTLDELRWLYIPELSEAAQNAFRRIEAVLPKVSEEANAERIKELPSSGLHHKNPKAEAERLAEDWSEVRPEWGLARNAAFIIGDRELTKDCNLEGRAFLHNYDWRKDKDGALLANIIKGPATVCQWINLQYYASTVAPHYYGSGNKATQTVTAGIGVMQGNASDLLFGLPWQSVMQSDQKFYHSPLRLLVVIQAPKEYVVRLMDHDSAFRQKVKNGWVRLASIDPNGNWENWS